MFIPEVLLSARTMEAGMEILRPLLTEKQATAVGTLVIGTVEGDIRSIARIWLPKFAETINALKEAGIRDRLKIMAGGAPVSRDFVVKIGGDGYGSNATAAVDGAKALIGRQSHRVCATDSGSLRL